MPFEPTVSIVIVNLNGLRHLDECFKSIQRLDYPKEKIEVVMVDNGSTDGSIEFMRKKYSWVKLIRNTKNEGFAKPSNDGARAATGEYVAFLNNDMKVQKRWLAELVASLEAQKADCAASLILNWDGSRLDFAGGSVSFYGAGFQFDVKRLFREMEAKLAKDTELLFPCGGAMLIKRDLFLEVGGFDEDYFAYYEDIDLGWRLNVLGYKIVLSTRSRVYHKHNSTGSKLGNARLKFLFHRNSLCTLYKNCSDELLGKTFWPSILMDGVMIYRSSSLSADSFEMNGYHNHKGADRYTVNGQAAAQLCAQSQFVSMLSVMTEKRNYIQKNRKVSDEELMRFFPDPLICAGPDIRYYSNIKYEIADAFGIAKTFKVDLKRTVLLITNDRLGAKMAGPAIRYCEIARALSKQFDVVLASIGDSPYKTDEFRTVAYTMADMTDLLEEAVQADIVMLQGFTMEFSPNLVQIMKTKYTIFDLYDPIVIEVMDSIKDKPMEHRFREYQSSSKALDRQLRMGDFFVAANEKQIDYWLGMLTSAGRVNPKAYDYTNNFNKIISQVPFGISDTDPVHTRNVLKGAWPGINKDDFLMVWGGGVWNWFDPLSLIHAVGKVSQTHKNVKLFFMGVKSPNPDVPEMEMLNKAVELSKELGLYDTHVFFNFGWVDYADRQNYLLEADVGVSFHYDTLETRFSFRTRILDYLWANLPIICTKGDYFAELIEEKGLGATVGYESADEIAAAIIKLADDKEFYKQCKNNMLPVADSYRWSRVTQPIIDFCNHPVHNKAEQPPTSEPESFSKEKNGEYESDYGSQYESDSAYRKSGVASAPSVRPARRGSVQQMLYDIEQQQVELQRMVRSVSHDGHSANERLAELQTWSYMMNDRFNKFKGIASPFAFLKRLFRRR